MSIKKAIIPAAGLGTRFLPISKVVAKELLPLVDLPMVSYVVKEARDSNIEKLCFVVSERKKIVQDYFKKLNWLENILEKRNKKELLETLRNSDNEFKPLSFSFALQDKPLGDGDAVLQAKKFAGKDGCGVMFADDIFEAKKPVLGQLNGIFKTCQKPVVGLKRLSPEKLSAYGIVKVEKIANRLYKIKGIVEKPKTALLAPSDLAIAGRYILTPEVFDYLKKTRRNEKGEIILAEALKLMLQDGKLIYGYEIDADWLECGNKTEWLKTNFHLCLKHPQYGPILREWLKKAK